MKLYTIIVGCIIASIYGLSLYYILSNITTLSKGFVGVIVGTTSGLFTILILNIINKKIKIKC